MQHITIPLRVLVAVSMFLTFGCPVRYQLKLTNQGTTAIRVIASASGRQKATVDAGATAVVEYPSSCLILEVGDQRFQYSAQRPPSSEYAEIHTFSVLMFGRYLGDGRLSLYSPKHSADEIPLSLGCVLPE